MPSKKLINKTFLSPGVNFSVPFLLNFSPEPVLQFVMGYNKTHLAPGWGILLDDHQVERIRVKDDCKFGTLSGGLYLVNTPKQKPVGLSRQVAH